MSSDYCLPALPDLFTDRAEAASQDDWSADGIRATVPFVTIAICTWNRASLLRQTLTHLRALVVPEGLPWELVIVDNNSTDATCRVIREFEKCLPIVELFVPEQGVANARNAAARAAKGLFVICLDDDVRVDPQLLMAYLDAFRTWPNVAFFGGPIEPIFEGTPPPWALGVRASALVFGALDYGSAPIELSPRHLPFGANMAFATHALKRFVFDPALGRRAGGMLNGEETHLCMQLLGEGLGGRWVPGARLRHYVPIRHQTISHLRCYYAGAGRTNALRAGDMRSLGRLTKGLWLYRQWIVAELLYWYRRLTAKPNVWLPLAAHASGWWGHIQHWRGESSS